MSTDQVEEKTDYLVKLLQMPDGRKIDFLGEIVCSKNEWLSYSVKIR